ncbi:DUF2069 domain-containing protein [Marinicellulosiphila megalodicopiae]|uniref:DUF2069 domain-containing protein n=1 Tax=Marinicellulosiphila megalodicopiae TaxID=2724896 RepID=UPI003BAE3727
MSSLTYFKISVASLIAVVLLFVGHTLSNGLIQVKYNDMPQSSLISGVVIFSLIKVIFLLAFIPAYLSKNIKSLSWMCYVIMLYLIYTCVVAFNTYYGEPTILESAQQFSDRIIGGLLSVTLLVQFFATSIYIRKEKIKLGLIIGK